MLNSRGFDLWADGYDAAVGLSDEDGSYPFAGYRAVLGEIYRVIMEKPGTSVLDLGFGTATLTSKLYEGGHEIYGQDFSRRMLEIASEKMPGAHLYMGDLAEGLAPELLLDLLCDGGMILIGDVAFETEREMDICRAQAADEWDGEEIYIVASELRKQFPDLQFETKSFCAGVLTLKKDDGIRTDVIKEGDSLWETAAEYASGVSWKAGPYLANMMRTGQFRDWERVIVAREGDEILGFCDFTEYDDMPEEKGYSPFIGFVFVGEQHRGRRISQRMIEKACQYAKSLGYGAVYLTSTEHGLYEKYGFEKVSDEDTVFDTHEQLFRRII